MENKLNFSKKLKILFEQESNVFMNNVVSNTSISNDGVESEIAAAGPLYGLKYLGVEEGVLSFSTYQKQSIKNFSDLGYIIPLYDIDNLEEALKEAKTFKNKSYVLLDEYLFL